MFGIFKPKAHIDRVSSDSLDSTYSRLRWQLFIGIFVGYAGYYLPISDNKCDIHGKV